MLIKMINLEFFQRSIKAILVENEGLLRRKSENSVVKSLEGFEKINRSSRN